MPHYKQDISGSTVVFNKWNLNTCKTCLAQSNKDDDWCFKATCAHSRLNGPSNLQS